MSFRFVLLPLLISVKGATFVSMPFYQRYRIHKMIENSSGEVDVNSLEFFDLTLTLSNLTREVNCCHKNQRKEKVQCGSGTSCADQCSARGAALCPSGICSGNLADCEQGLDLLIRSNAATNPTSDLRFCVRESVDCNVQRHPQCCYHPVCFARDKCKVCKFLEILRTSMQRYCNPGTSGSTGNAGGSEGNIQ